MTRKKDKIKICQLNGIKKRRMQKYHARRIMRLNNYQGHIVAWLRLFVSSKYLSLDPELRRCVGTYKIRFQEKNKNYYAD